VVGLPPTADRVVAVRAETDDGSTLLGSGYIVGPGRALTAWHCTIDPASSLPISRLEIIRESDGASTAVRRVIGSHVLDMAVLEFDAASLGTADLTPVAYAQLERSHAGELSPFVAAGYPLFQRDPSAKQRNLAEIRGSIRVLDDLAAGYLLLRDPQLESVTASDAALSGARPWSGLSGATVFYGEYAVGIVVQHDRRQGSSALRVRAISDLAERSRGEDRELAHALGFGTPASLPVIHDDALPPGTRRPWLLPATNPGFTGRRDEISTLEGAFKADGIPVTQTLRGPAGVGKSQIAVEYAYRHATDYDAVWWVPASDERVISGEIRRLLREMGEPVDELDDSDLVARLASSLSGTDRWLLIFDDAQGPEVVSRWTRVDPATPGSRRHILVTTRRPRFDRIGGVVPVEVWDETQSVDYLRSRIPDDEDTAAERLARLLGGLPLALEQACSYMSSTGTPVDEYAELFETRSEEMLGKGTVFGTDATVATLWDLALDQIAATDDAALDIVDACSYLADSKIPLDLFRRNAGHLSEPLASRATDALLFNETVGLLADFGIATRSGRALRFHSLTQTAVRARHVRDDAGLDCYLPGVIYLLRAACPRIVIGKGSRDEYRTQWGPLLPHVLSATQLYVREPSLEVATARVCVDLLSDAASYLYTAGAYIHAASLNELALGYGAENEIFENPREAARRFIDVANAYKAIGRPGAALPFAKRALELMIDSYGESDPDTIVDLSTYARILDDLGEHDAAQASATRALRLTQEVFGDEDMAFARRANDLGLVLLHTGDLAGAEARVTAALRTATAARGETDVESAQILGNLGAITHARGDENTARRQLERACDYLEASLGARHPALRYPWSVLVDVYEGLRLFELRDQMKEKLARGG